MFFIFWTFTNYFCLSFRSLLSKSPLHSFQSIRKYYHKMLFLSIILFVLYQISSAWRRPVITEDDLNTLDVFTWLNNPKSKSYLGVLFTFSLVFIFLLTPLPCDTNSPRNILISSFIFVYLFRFVSSSVFFIVFC